VLAAAEDAAALLAALEIPAAPVVRQVRGSVMGQELALRNPELVCSPAAGGSQPRVQGGRLKGRVVRRGNPSGSRGSELAGWGPKPGERCWPVRALL
jgi:hypothetical protein